MTTPSSPSTLRLAALAVRDRLRRRAARAAVFFRPNASRLLALPGRLAAAAAALGRRARSPLGLAAILLVALPAFVFWAQTNPALQASPTFSRLPFQRFFMTQLLDGGFLEPKADFVAGRCADGSVARRGHGVDCQGLVPLGDAREMFDDALVAYRGGPLSALSPQRAAAARALAASMASSRLSSGAALVAGFSIAAIEAAIVLFGALGWLAVFLRSRPATQALGKAFCLRLLEGRPGKPAPAAVGPISYRLAAVAIGMLLSAVVFGSAASGMGAVALYKLAPDTAAGDFALSLLARDAAASRAGSPMALSPDFWRHGWTAPPNDYRLVNAASVKRPSEPGLARLGSWTPGEMFSAQAPRLLAERAPLLTQEQRAAALLEFQALRQRIGDWGMACFTPGFVLFLSLALLWLALFFGFKALLALGRSGQKAIAHLAEEGAQLPLAQHERAELLDALGDDAKERDGDAPLPRRDPRRL